MKKPEVMVLLSIYRGQEFIDEQLNSLVSQDGVDIRLLFHMDEEDLPTEAKVREAFPEAQRIAAKPGMGLPRAFFELIRASPRSDFYAFCDQDDVWHPRKLTTAVGALASKQGSPTLWICRVQPFKGSTPNDYNGDPYPNFIPKASFGNALVETIGPGCAMVWNRKLHNSLRRGQVIEGALMHDSWAYLVATGLGEVIVEPNPMVWYRLHQSNAVGIRNSFHQRMKRFLTNRQIGGPSILTQAGALLNHHGSELRGTDLGLAKRLATGTVLERIRLAMNKEVYRHSSSEQPMLTLRLIMR